MLTIPVHVIKQREAKGGTFTSYKRHHIIDYYIVLLYYSKELNFSRKKKKKKERNLYFSYQMHILGKCYHTPWRVMFGAENFKLKPYSL